MGQSIQRGGHWWNQRPDGVWLRWSDESRSWEPQASAPPPPPPPRPAGAPPPPVAGTSEFDQTTEIPKPAAAEGDTKPLIVGSAPQVPVKANAAVISAPRKDPTALLENQKVLAVLGVVAIVLVFLGTYFAATKIFGGTAAVASEPVVSKPRGMSEQKWDYIQRADAICRRAEKRGASFERRIYASMTASNFGAMGSALRDARAYTIKVNKQIFRLKRPREDRRLLERLVDRFPRELAVFDRLIAGVESANLEAIEDATADMRVVTARSDIMADRYGFEDC